MKEQENIYIRSLQNRGLTVQIAWLDTDYEGWSLDSGKEEKQKTEIGKITKPWSIVSNWNVTEGTLTTESCKEDSS